MISDIEIARAAKMLPIGEVVAESQFLVTCGSEGLIDTDIAELKSSWIRRLDWK